MYCRCSLASRSHTMATNDTKDWSELLDVVLFEADRVNLQQRMEHATDAIHRRIEELLKRRKCGQHPGTRCTPQRSSNLADLQKITSARKPSGRVSRENGRAIGS